MVRKIKNRIEKKEKNHDYLLEYLDIPLLGRMFQCNYSHEVLISEYKDILREFEKRTSYGENISRLIYLVMEDTVYKNIILDRLVRYNNKIVLEMGDPDLQEEELIEEIRECTGFLTQGRGLNAQQMLLYYYSEKDFDNKMIKEIFEIMKEEEIEENLTKEERKERYEKKKAEENEKILKEEERIKNLSEEELELELNAEEEALIAEYEKLKNLVAELRSDSYIISEME